MSLDLTSEINAMISERNMSEEQVISLIQDMIRSAYKKKFGTDENCLIEFDDSMRKMSVYQIRKVVKEEDWYSEFTEIPVEDAIELTGSEKTDAAHRKRHEESAEIHQQQFAVRQSGVRLGERKGLRGYHSLCRQGRSSGGHAGGQDMPAGDRRACKIFDSGRH